MKKAIILIGTAVFMPAVMAFSGEGGDVVRLGHSSNAEVIAAMTLEEKAELLVGDDLGFPRGYPWQFGGVDELYGKVATNVGQTKKLVDGAAGSTYAIPRLGIPAIVLADGPAGVRIDPRRQGTDQTFFATGFPIGTLMASTWNTEMVNQVGMCMGNEVLEYGVDVLLAPALNIHRNPLGGRNFEYYSEDPVLSGETAAAMVNGVQANGVGTSIKHFAANNNEANRMNINAVIDPHTLHEIYLKGFEITVKKSHPWTVMSSYNKINGTYSAENSWLLNDVLRDAWGFDGLVMTDWFGGKDRLEQVRAGNDLLMPGSKFIANQIVEAVRSGELDEKLVDRNIDRILDVIKRTPRFKGYEYSNAPDLKAHAQVAKRAAIEGMILLKNDAGALPLDKNLKTIASFGLGFFNTITVGTGSGNVNTEYTVSIEAGLKAMGYIVPEEMKEAYAKHLASENERVGQKSSYFLPDLKLNEKAWTESELQSIADKTDVAVITIMRRSGEFEDRKLEDDFELSSIEKDLIEKASAVFHAKGKKVVVLLNVSGVVETASWKSLADAILLIWQPGQEAGNAVAEILAGKASPSGRLPMTFPVKYTDVPSATSFPDQSLNPETAVYEEKGLVGYRYYQSKKVPVSYAFGFGLSFTDFECTKGKLIKGKTPGVKIRVTNTGKSAGREVLQLYVKNPGRDYFELKAFMKTAVLEPGQTEKVKLTVSQGDLKIYDEVSSSWVLAEGEYEVALGTSSDQFVFKGTINL